VLGALTLISEQYAVNYNHPEVALFLIDAGADPQEGDMEQTYVPPLRHLQPPRIVP
jgi:hypothetical protein